MVPTKQKSDISSVQGNSCTAILNAANDVPDIVPLLNSEENLYSKNSTPGKDCFTPSNLMSSQCPIITPMGMNVSSRLESRKQGSINVHRETCSPMGHDVPGKDSMVEGSRSLTFLQVENGHIPCVHTTSNGIAAPERSDSPKEIIGMLATQDSCHGAIQSNLIANEVHLKDPRTFTAFTRLPPFPGSGHRENFTSQLEHNNNEETSMHKRGSTLHIFSSKDRDNRDKGSFFPEATESNFAHLDIGPFAEHRFESRGIQQAGISQRGSVIQGKNISTIIKATYKVDTVRFRLPLNAGVSELRDEVAKRFKLESGTFDLKYLDDEYDWVLVACDADFQECISIINYLGGKAVKLAVRDIFSNIGNSCESARYPNPH